MQRASSNFAKQNGGVQLGVKYEMLIACRPALRSGRKLNVCNRSDQSDLFRRSWNAFYLTKTVGDHYAYVGREVGLDLDAQKLERAFHTAWKEMPQRAAIDGPRENDDKGWWRELVDLVLDQVAPSLSEFDRDNFFEIAYEHFAEAGVWELYPEVPGVLERTAAAVPTRRNFKFRRAFALHSRTPRYLEIFHATFSSPASSGQTNLIRKSIDAH